MSRDDPDPGSCCPGVDILRPNLCKYGVSRMVQRVNICPRMVKYGVSDEVKMGSSEGPGSGDLGS